MAASNVTDIPAGVNVSSPDPSDEGYLFYSKLGMSASLAATSAALHLFAVAVHQRIDIAHPVFAIVFQEIVVLACLCSTLLLALLLLMAEYFRLWLALLCLTSVLALQFHQVTWLVATTLRYQLIVRNDSAGGGHVDMGVLRRSSLRRVWLLYFPACAVGAATLFRMMTWAGWPGRMMQDVPPRRQVLVLSAFEAVMNLPDAASVAVYLAILRHVWKKRRRQQEQEEDRAAEAPPTAFFNNSVFPSAPVGDEQDGATDPDKAAAAKTDNEERSVLRTLATHLALSGLDLAFPLVAGSLPAGPPRHFLVTHFFVAGSFWVPMVVIGRNFHKMNELLAFYLGRIF